MKTHHNKEAGNRFQFFWCNPLQEKVFWYLAHLWQLMLAMCWNYYLVDLAVTFHSTHNVAPLVLSQQLTSRFGPTSNCFRRGKIQICKQLITQMRVLKQCLTLLYFGKRFKLSPALITKPQDNKTYAENAYLVFQLHFFDAQFIFHI